MVWIVSASHAHLLYCGAKVSIETLGTQMEKEPYCYKQLHMFLLVLTKNVVTSGMFLIIAEASGHDYYLTEIIDDKSEHKLK